jgi:hypothetical protein
MQRAVFATQSPKFKECIDLPPVAAQPLILSIDEDAPEVSAGRGAFFQVARTADRNPAPLPSGTFHVFAVSQVVRANAISFVLLEIFQDRLYLL